MEEKTILTNEGPVTISGLVKKLQGSILEIGGEVEKTDDSALVALAGYDETTHILDSMTQEERDDFIDSFCEAWAQSGV